MKVWRFSFQEFQTMLLFYFSRPLLFVPCHKAWWDCLTSKKVVSQIAIWKGLYHSRDSIYSKHVFKFALWTTLPSPPLVAESNLLCRCDAVSVGSLLSAHLPSALPNRRHSSSQDNWDLSQSACIWPCGGEIRVGFICLWETVQEMGSQEAWETPQRCRSLDALSAFTQKPCGKRLLNKHHSQHRLQIPTYLSLTYYCIDIDFWDMDRSRTNPKSTDKCVW